MAGSTVIRLYGSQDAAARTVAALEAAGFPREDIALVGGDAESAAAPILDAPEDPLTDHGDTAGGAGTGASIGSVLGGGTGLLAGLGLLAVPGLGPVVAAGWLVSALAGAAAGAAAGGLLGALTEAGVEEESARDHAEGVRRGGTLVTLRAPDPAAIAMAERIMARHGPIEPPPRDGA
ncbi:hypothetical protein M0638_06520 [Roseomonas sp. NAR14]|uniref:General stress protein 17M-like domain-containing protein n=1 Tax=Roseomonas acroporae TaxID=2937791 RepID=A0A9X2BSY3_9PROT|nr:hypothetical protein [Roseomonas acroporae]MCK8784033.1 hypothetical protein [Roseomonas acroporae]